MKTKLFLNCLLLVLGISEAWSQNVIGRSDSVSVKVFREPDLDARGEVNPDGTMTVPLIGAVKISGLTTSQAEAAIEKRLRDGYLVRPQVSVNIVQRVVRTVTVLGQAREPGVFTLPSNRQLTLIEAIGMAGGLTDIANPKKVILKVGKTGQTRMIDVRSIMKGRSSDITLGSGDIVNIPESWF